MIPKKIYIFICLVFFISFTVPIIQPFSKSLEKKKQQITQPQKPEEPPSQALPSTPGDQPEEPPSPALPPRPPLQAPPALNLQPQPIQPRPPFFEPIQVTKPALQPQVVSTPRPTLQITDESQIDSSVDSPEGVRSASPASPTSSDSSTTSAESDQSDADLATAVTASLAISQDPQTLRENEFNEKYPELYAFKTKLADVNLELKAYFSSCEITENEDLTRLNAAVKLLDQKRFIFTPQIIRALLNPQAILSLSINFKDALEQILASAKDAAQESLRIELIELLDAWVPFSTLIALPQPKPLSLEEKINAFNDFTSLWLSRRETSIGAFVDQLSSDGYSLATYDSETERTQKIAVLRKNIAACREEKLTEAEADFFDQLTQLINAFSLKPRKTTFEYPEASDATDRREAQELRITKENKLNKRIAGIPVDNNEVEASTESPAQAPRKKTTRTSSRGNPPASPLSRAKPAKKQVRFAENPEIIVFDAFTPEGQAQFDSQSEFDFADSSGAAGVAAPTRDESIDQADPIETILNKVIKKLKAANDNAWGSFMSMLYFYNDGKKKSAGSKEMGLNNLITQLDDWLFPKDRLPSPDASDPLIVETIKEVLASIEGASDTYRAFIEKLDASSKPPETSTTATASTPLFTSASSLAASVARAPITTPRRPAESRITIPGTRANLFEKVFGVSETAFLKNYALLNYERDTQDFSFVTPSQGAFAGKKISCGKFKEYSITELIASTEGLPASPTKGFFNVIEGDVTQLQADPANRDAVFQVASRFHALDGDSLQDYVGNRTQGPTAALSALGGALLRHYFLYYNPANQDPKKWRQRSEQFVNLLDGLTDIPPQRDGRPDFTTLPNAFPSEADCKNIKIAFHENIQVIADGGFKNAIYDKDQCISQVLTSVIDLSAYPTVLNTAEGKSWVAAMLNASYEGTLRAAALHKKKKVFLTLMGGGVFENPPEFIGNAIVRMKDFIVANGLEVTIILYDKTQVDARLYAQLQRLAAETSAAATAGKDAGAASATATPLPSARSRSARAMPTASSPGGVAPVQAALAAQRAAHDELINEPLLKENESSSLIHKTEFTTSGEEVKIPIHRIIVKKTSLNNGEIIRIIGSTQMNNINPGTKVSYNPSTKKTSFLGVLPSADPRKSFTYEIASEENDIFGLGAPAKK